MRCYAGNLPYAVGDVELRELFEAVGQVDDAKVIMDRDSGRSKGFGFVDMPDDVARKAIEQLNGKDVEGRKLVVNEARPREERRR